MELLLSTQSYPAGFRTTLYVVGAREEVAGTHYADGRSADTRSLAHAGRAKFSPTLAGALEDLRKNVTREVKRLEKHGDLRPSQVRRLELLKQFLGG